MYGIGGILVNNFTEIAGMGLVALVFYRSGRFIQKRWPNQHLRPWLWFKRRD